MSRLLSKSESNNLKLTQPIPVTLHPAAVYLDSLGKGSKLTMTSSLNTIASILSSGECDAFTLDWSKLRYRHTAIVRSVLEKRYEATTANKILCGLRRVLQEARKLDLMEQVDYVAAVDIADLKTSGKLRGRALTKKEIDALMDSCTDYKPLDIRDRALIAILRGGGLRRAELVNLNLADYHPSKYRLDIIQGKGGKDRMVYLPKSGIFPINEWLKLRGKENGPLICPVFRGGKVLLKRLSTDGVLGEKPRYGYCWRK
jgi:site-specific recombinase XerD